MVQDQGDHFEVEEPVEQTSVVEDGGDELYVTDYEQNTSALDQY